MGGEEASDMDGKAEARVSGNERVNFLLPLHHNNKRCLDFARHDKDRGHCANPRKRRF